MLDVSDDMASINLNDDEKMIYGLPDRSGSESNATKLSFCSPD